MATGLCWCVGSRMGPHDSAGSSCLVGVGDSGCLEFLCARSCWARSGDVAVGRVECDYLLVDARD